MSHPEATGAASPLRCCLVSNRRVAPKHPASPIHGLFDAHLQHHLQLIRPWREIDSARGAPSSHAPHLGAAVEPQADDFYLITATSTRSWSGVRLANHLLEHLTDQVNPMDPQHVATDARTSGALAV